MKKLRDISPSLKTMEKPLKPRPSIDNRAEWNHSQERSDQANYDEVRVVKLQDKINGRQQHQAPRRCVDRDVEIDKLRRELKGLKIKFEHTEKECAYLRQLTREQEGQLTKYGRDNQKLEKCDGRRTDSTNDRTSGTKICNDSISQRRLNDQTTSYPDSPNGKKLISYPPEFNSRDQGYYQGSWDSRHYDYRYSPARYLERDPYYNERSRTYSPSYQHSDDHSSYHRYEMYRPRDPNGYSSNPYYQSRDYSCPPVNYDSRKGGYCRPNPQDMWTNSKRGYGSGYDSYGQNG